MKRLYVANLPYKIADRDFSEEDLRAFFPGYQIESIKMITDATTRRFRGFAFLEMASGEEAERALELNGAMLNGRPVRIEIANERDSQGGGNGGRGGRGGGRQNDRGGRGGGGGRAQRHERGRRGRDDERSNN